MTKSIKIATGLTRMIEMGTERSNAIGVWEIVKLHRAVIIDRMLAGLSTYVDYKFPDRKATRDQLNRITDDLLRLKDSTAFERYTDIIDSVLNNNRDAAHIEQEPFLAEINEIIQDNLAMAVHR